jgi:hypothetical protein
MKQKRPGTCSFSTYQFRAIHMRVSRAVMVMGSIPAGNSSRNPTWKPTFGDMMVTPLSMVGLRQGRYVPRYGMIDGKLPSPTHHERPRRRVMIAFSLHWPT